jgi:hypothetical protein
MIEALAAGALVAVLASPLAAVASGGRGWRGGADVDVSAVRAPYARVRLPVAVDPTDAGDYHDLRVLDEHGAEVPYAIDPQPQPEPDVALPMTDRGFVPRRGTQAVFDLGNEGTLHDALTLRIGRDTYFTRVAVDASDDARGWRTIRDDALVYHVAQDDRGDATVTFTPTRARWVRVRVLDGRAAFPIDGATLAHARSARPPLMTVARSGDGERPKDEPNVQRYTIDLHVRNAAVAAVRVDAATPAFSRDVAVETSADGVTWFPVANDRIARFEHGVPHLDVSTDNARARRWRVTIRNGGDAPLRGVRVTLLACPHDLVFPVRPGRRYAVVFDRPTLDGPAYDLPMRLAHEDWTADRASLSPVVALTPAVAGPVEPRIPGWLTATAFGGAILVLAAFAVRLVRTPAGDDEERAA